MFDWDDGGADQFQFQNDPFGDGPNRTDPSAPNYDPWGSGTLPNGAPMFGQLGASDVIGGIADAIGGLVGGLEDSIAGAMGTDLSDFFNWLYSNPMFWDDGMTVNVTTDGVFDAQIYDGAVIRSVYATGWSITITETVSVNLR